MKLQSLGTLILTALISACAATGGKASTADKSASPAVSHPVAPSELYRSTYKVPQSAPTLIRNATVLTGTGTRLEEKKREDPVGRAKPAGTGRRPDHRWQRTLGDPGPD